MVEFPSLIVDGVQHYIVYFEQDGEEIYQFRAQADIVTVPDQEILKVAILCQCFKTPLLHVIL